MKFFGTASLTLALVLSTSQTSFAQILEEPCNPAGTSDSAFVMKALDRLEQSENVEANDVANFLANVSLTATMPKGSRTPLYTVTATNTQGTSVVFKMEAGCKAGDPLKVLSASISRGRPVKSIKIIRE